MKLTDLAKNQIMCFDGGTGSVLQARGLKPGELPEMWNISHPEEIINLHREYLLAGCDIIKTNTFGANKYKFTGKDCVPSVEEIVIRAMENAHTATEGLENKFIALDIGPCGKLLKPLGELEFEEAVEIFAQVVRAGKDKADLILIETMNDSYETKAAVLAAKENSSLPIFVTNVYDSSAKLMTGACPEAMAAMLEGLGVDAVGVNCSLGPKEISPVVERLIKTLSVPVIMNPNAGLPIIKEGKTCYDISPEEFAMKVASMAKTGVSYVGGCCGTTPEHIKLLKEKIKDISPKEITDKNLTVVSSYTHAVNFGKDPVIIGERINPTGKKAFKEALRCHDLDYILREGISQQECGAHILDVNVGLPEIDEPEMMCEVVSQLQAICDLPLQVDTTNTLAMEKALRLCNGKAMINSVNGKQESMDNIFPLAAKYGGVIVALTLDETGIPSTAKGRFDIAEKIVKEAGKYGLSKKDFIIDPLAMAVSSDANSATITLDAIKMLTAAGYKTSLGVSNISFGLPSRELINSTFFASALSAGLSAGIINPKSEAMMSVYYSYRALFGLDEACSDYINKTAGSSTPPNTPISALSLSDCVVKGLKSGAGEAAKELIHNKKPMDIINDDIIPALDIVGKGFEKGTMFLPQLLMSADAAKAAFDVIKTSIGKSNGEKCTVVIATVYGDIHDIGKNIVKVLLENYGFNVIDLGKDVPPQTVADAVVKYNAPLVGLSALMTTTVPAMEETIKLIKELAPGCLTMVGGAVLTQEYSDMIGADKYCSDAMETVRYADEINSKLNNI